MDLPSFFWATSTTGSCGFAIADSGMSAEPAAAATVVMKCLRESSPKRVMVPPAAWGVDDGYCIHYSRVWRKLPEARPPYSFICATTAHYILRHETAPRSEAGSLSL